MISSPRGEFHATADPKVSHLWFSLEEKGGARSLLNISMVSRELSLLLENLWMEWHGNARLVLVLL